MAEAPLRVCFPFVGDTIGGSHISALTLIAALDRTAVEPRVVVHGDGPLTERLRAEGLDFERLPLPRLVGRDRRWSGHLAALARTAPPLRRYLRAEAIDLVHSNDARMHLTWALPARLAGCGHLWHERNRFGASRLARLLLRLPGRVAAISRFVAGSLPASARSRTSVVPNPFAPPEAMDRAACRAALLDALALPAETAVVGWFGNLIAWKRPLLFVEAAALLAERLERPCVFPVFGEDRDGLMAEMLASAERRGIADRLRFQGFRQPVWPWLAGCDLLLAPAVDEPFGRTLVEAMLVGTPVVASDAGGHREIVASGETGLLVPPDDAEALAEAGARLLSDAPLRQRLTERARAEAPARFGAAAHAARVTGLYRQLCQPRDPAAVALVIADLGAGGAQRVVATLAGAWADRGRPVTLITFDDGAGDAFALDPRVERIALGLQGDSAGPLQALRATWRRIRALRAALRASGATTAIGFVGATNVLLVLAGRGLGLRLAISERNDPARQSLGRPWDALRRRCYRWADVVTANSPGALESLARWVPRPKLALVDNPLAVPTAGEVRRRAEDFGAPTLLAIGRLDRQKAYDVLLEAFAAAGCRAQGWRLLIVGSGPERGHLAARAEALGIGAEVTWREHVADPLPLYAGAEALVLPSRFEGTPNVLLEALACGCPAVVSETAGAAPALVGDQEAGLVVPGEDSAALAAAIDRLAGDAALRRRLGAAGPGRVGRFALERVLPAWDALLAPGPPGASEALPIQAP